MRTLGIAAALVALLGAASAAAQQTGRIEGVVRTGDGAAVAGVTVVARSDVMPRPRTAATDEAGRYALAALIPGAYRLHFTSPSAPERRADVVVLLGQTTKYDMRLAATNRPDSLPVEEVLVVAERIAVRGDAAIANAFDGDAVQGVPLGFGYRDLVKLAPGVQVTQDAVRGPAAGGSGQDNVYRFDGVDVSLPMFGTLSAEPSSHDVDQVTFARGGASAVGFNRSGGFAMDSISKSGTDEFQASIEIAAQPGSLVAENRVGESAAHRTDRSWITVTGSGPLLPSRLFAYGSFYRPAEQRGNKATAYGPAKDYSNTRREYYAKLTFAPADAVLLSASFRTSRRTEQGVSVGPFEADSASVGGLAEQDVTSVDGSWIAPSGVELSFRFSDYALAGTSRPDVFLAAQPSLAGTLDVGNLDRMGHFSVPSPVAGDDAFNAAIAPLIERYGYLDAAGRRQGGGAVGAHPQIGDQSFRRRGIDLTLDHDFVWGSSSHDLHLGWRATQARETVQRTSNGWGSITVPGGIDHAADGTPIFYAARVEQMSLPRPDGTTVPPIDSYTESSSLAVNDRVAIGSFAFNLGVLVSEDVLFGQGLRPAAGTRSGFALAPGEKYRMHTLRWRDMVQPRMAVEWAWNGADTVFLSFASYNPEANSLARAASWDRNTRASLRVLFDEAGRVIEHQPYPGSSGKIFQEGLTPRRIDEWTVGFERALPRGFALSAHLRRRDGAHFWEDTGNLSRSYDNAPPHIARKGAYVPDLGAVRAEIGGSSYVVAELDDAYTRFWEAAAEVEWQGERGFLHASYSRSRYTGNFDQDNTSGVNDANRFIGSSNLADGYGRQLWDNKDGVLRGDRPHLVKAFGYFDLAWRARIGALFFYQSGQPWEAWDSLAYGLPSYYSSTIRYAEPAGSRRSASHWQLDLSYAQSLRLPLDAQMQVRIEMFNVFDRQTGYNINPYRRDAAFGMPRNHFDSRRVRVSFKVEV